eukprot:TRINITY_DN5327_c0_g1_i2.p1 TRINITY_DN5327_c0_g1~~TRINITY_DN5327_c0_g1_i2.p1  ORF type:complete len:198 (-),score=18.65 TRINITY_DN5327_c0_g1_i2:266-859(-)
MAGVVLHVRNIPCKILEDKLSETIREVGLDASRYELYLPKRPGRQGRFNNFGYGFVTCRGTEDAEAFTRVMQGHRFQNIDSLKHLVIEPGNSNYLDESNQWAVDQPGSTDMYQAVTQTSHDRGFGATWSYSTDCMSSADQHRQARREHSMGWDGYGPDERKVPQTRLASIDVLDDHFTSESSCVQIDEPSRAFFRFQ